MLLGKITGGNENTRSIKNGSYNESKNIFAPCWLDGDNKLFQPPRTSVKVWVLGLLFFYGVIDGDAIKNHTIFC